MKSRLRRFISSASATPFFRDVTDHWICREKTVLLNFRPFTEFGIFDGAIDAERKRQLAVDKFRAFQSGESVGEKTLFGGDCRHTLILKIVGPGYAYAARAVHVDAVAVNIDGLARNSKVFESRSVVIEEKEAGFSFAGPRSLK